MIQAIFKAVQDGVTGFIGVLQSAFSGVGQMFISGENELTYFGFRLIKSLVGRAA